MFGFNVRMSHKNLFVTATPRYKIIRKEDSIAKRTLFNSYAFQKVYLNSPMNKLITLEKWRPQKGTPLK